MSKYYRIMLNDGTSFSVQASSFNYCQPRVDDADCYSEVEIGFPSVEIQLIAKYKEIPDYFYGDSVYPFVPVEIVRQVIKSAGGLKTLSPIPPGILLREDYADLYKRCSEKIPPSYKAEWLLRKKELQDIGADLSPHQWYLEIHSFMDSALIKNALNHWVEFRTEEMQEWEIDNIPDDVDPYEHYKKFINGWSEKYPLNIRLSLIKSQLDEDIQTVTSHEDWLMYR